MISTWSFGSEPTANPAPVVQVVPHGTEAALPLPVARCLSTPKIVPAQAPLPTPPQTLAAAPPPAQLRPAPVPPQRPTSAVGGSGAAAAVSAMEGGARASHPLATPTGLGPGKSPLLRTGNLAAASSEDSQSAGVPSRRPPQPPAEDSGLLMRPCVHNKWDDVRTRRHHKILQCRECRSKWKIRMPINTCTHWPHGRCARGDGCELLHVSKRKFDAHGYSEAVLAGPGHNLAKDASPALRADVPPGAGGAAVATGAVHSADRHQQQSDTASATGYSGMPPLMSPTPFATPPMTSGEPGWPWTNAALGTPAPELAHCPAASPMMAPTLITSPSIASPPLASLPVAQLVPSGARGADAAAMSHVGLPQAAVEADTRLPRAAQATPSMLEAVEASGHFNCQFSDRPSGASMAGCGPLLAIATARAHSRCGEEEEVNAAPAPQGSQSASMRTQNVTPLSLLFAPDPRPRVPMPDSPDRTSPVHDFVQPPPQRSEPPPPPPPQQQQQQRPPLAPPPPQRSPQQQPALTPNQTPHQPQTPHTQPGGGLPNGKRGPNQYSPDQRTRLSIQYSPEQQPSLSSPRATAGRGSTAAQPPDGQENDGVHALTEAELDEMMSVCFAGGGSHTP
eukprot:TRINITY_DN4380_c3_g1_i1.p1 TRINITY_DN4380_c3_g1~~TRINITY_DN4380_c3_g1_i1.p1  ORF type:complete len:621 (+),score=67.13 TRINITY_DN4380_c3_g1_i1:116-1978(+)